MKLYHPTNGKGRVTRRFYYKDCKIYKWYEGMGCPHMGHDETGNRNSTIYSMMAGKVIEARMSDDGGYGNRVTILHPTGEKTLYAHLSKYLVSVGEEVEAGHVVGLMGETGVGGLHVHVECILPYIPTDRFYVPKTTEFSDGWAVDPYPYLLEMYGETSVLEGLVVIGDGVNVRSGPGKDYPKIAPALPRGTVLPVAWKTEEIDSDGFFWLRWAWFGEVAAWSAHKYRANTTYIEVSEVEAPIPPDPPIENCEKEFERGRIVGQQEVIAAVEKALSIF